MIRLAVAKFSKGYSKTLSIICAQQRPHSTNPDYSNKTEPYEIFKSRFMKAFDDPKIDGWWARTWMQRLHLEDAIPPPEVVVSGLKACRRLNDIALAIRFIESVKFKCQACKGSWDWLSKEIEPAMKELGLPTLEQLGYDKPELAIIDYDD
uniref:Cytochrome c oxidase subunit 5A, mitochondrial n=1 Tax=Schistosoma japonicum TaxID=6182 RepID=C1L8Y2_SCHJA|nr:Cytochrome C Oxidase [Schistosoma japonicum]